MIALPLLLLLASAQAEASAPAAPPTAAPTPSEPAATTWDVAPGSTLSCHVVHKFHSVNEVTRLVEGKARLAADGRLEVVVRARVASFDSGNANRDAHMLEVVDAARFPWVTLRGEASGVHAAPGADTVEVPLRAVLDFHGLQRPLDLAARVRFASPGRAEVEAAFPVSLGAHQVPRPALLFVKIEDRITITARLVFSAVSGP